MDLNELRNKLIAAARGQKPSTGVPYGFERRIAARIRGLATASVDHWALWSRALWRASAPCIAITILLAVWSLLGMANKPSGGDLSQELENTVLAAADVDQPPPETLR